MSDLLQAARRTRRHAAAPARRGATNLGGGGAPVNRRRAGPGVALGVAPTAAEERQPRQHQPYPPTTPSLVSRSPSTATQSSAAVRPETRAKRVAEIVAASVEGRNPLAYVKQTP